MREIKSKIVQVHFQCDVCGHGYVDQDEFPIRWKDFSKVGILRKKDKKTGKPFLLLKIRSYKCTCYDNG
jgi:hypothetical protein